MCGEADREGEGLVEGLGVGLSESVGVREEERDGDGDGEGVREALRVQRQAQVFAWHKMPGIFRKPSPPKFRQPPPQKIKQTTPKIRPSSGQPTKKLQ